MLQINNLDVYYGAVHALKKVSLQVAEGELVTLIGGNGAGKSTTLKTISGMLRPTNGEITFNGRRIDGMSPPQVVRLGIVHCPEGRRVFPDMTVADNLEMGGFTRKDRAALKEDMERAYELFPILKERRRQLAGTLSGGEQQMLAIGRSILSKPALLMFDEPSLGLAPIVIERVAETIRSIHASGTTVLLVEQNADLALDLADRAYVLETGSVVLEGPADELQKNEHVQKAYLGA